jgi:hypothetical protein
MGCPLKPLVKGSGLAQTAIFAVCDFPKERSKSFPGNGAYFGVTGGVATAFWKSWGPKKRV